MQKSIEQRKREHRKGAVTGVIFFSVLQLLSVAFFGCLAMIPDLPGWAVALFVLLAVGSLLMIFPVLRLLKQRFKEIEGGELYEAGKY